jgi:two-component system sensor histidine kinase PilS (NtrC family)
VDAPEPHVSSLREALFGLNRARLIAAALVLLVGGLLRQADVFPYPFGPFAMAVLAAAIACAILPLGHAFMVSPRRFAQFQLTLDVAVVTAIVAASGGARSLFVPLYVLVVMAGAFLLPRADGFALAGLSSALYLAVVLGRDSLALFGMAPGTESPVIQVAALALNAGVFLVVAGVTASLSERYRRSQERLEAQREHLSDVQAFRDQIFQSVGSGLVAVDADGRVTAFNRAAESITGLTAGQALGQPWGVIFGPGIDLEEVGEAAREDPSLPRRFEFSLRRQDGRSIPVGISFWPLRSGQGAVAGLIGVCQDLSAIKQLEQRMRQADRLAAVGRLSANMAHEIRNPLASISGAVEALAQDLPPDEGRNRLVEIVMRESQRLDHIVAAFLEYARPAPLAPIELNLADILDEVLLLIEHRDRSTDVRITRQYSDSLPAHADPQQMRQAIWNLCLNAVQSMPEGGELRVGGRVLPAPPRERIQIWVSDSGQGIAEEDLPHIFEPFYSTKAEGSGIGLALVYRVLQDHGGQVEARSGPGEGTTFTLTVPAMPQPLDAVLTSPFDTRRP